MKPIHLKTDILLGFFIASLILANTLGTKITSLFGVRVSVGIFFIPILFLVTDIIGEVHGKKKAQAFVYIAVCIMLFSILMTYLSIQISPNPAWEFQDQYALIFGNSLRMLIASIIAFVFSQFHDIWAFHFWKKVTKGKFMWLRNNMSTIASQLIDTTLFMFIAFYNISPKFNVMFIISLIIPYWLFKIAFAILDTPFFYLGVIWLRAGTEPTPVKSD